MNFYAIVNVLTGDLVETSYEPLTVEGSPFQVRTYDGYIPDMALVEWNRSTLSFDPK
jgi:hypothetical protein